MDQDLAGHRTLMMKSPTKKIMMSMTVSTVLIFTHGKLHDDDDADDNAVSASVFDDGDKDDDCNGDSADGDDGQGGCHGGGFDSAVGVLLQLVVVWRGGSIAIVCGCGGDLVVVSL